MSNDAFVNTSITYAVDVDGTFVLVENVPVRIGVETGEQLFAPETVERIQELAWSRQPPSRTVQSPVFDFAA